MPSDGTEKAFAWIGSIIVNVAFISFITWGATSNWWIGFTVSIFYTLLLFVLARVLDSENGWLVFFTRFRSPNDVEDIDRFNESLSQNQRPTMLVTLLYGLATLSLGVTGSFLSMNAINCSTDSHDAPQHSSDYKTDLSKLPSDVQKWVRKGDDHPHSNFVYLPGSKHTLFNEYVDDNMSKLWSVISPEAPTVLHKAGVYEFVVPNPSIACFITVRTPHTNDYYDNSRKIVACSDGMTMQFAQQNNNPIPANYRRNMFVSKDDHLVWYQDDPPSDPDRFKSSDRLVYSLDPNTMIETLHSEHVDNNKDDHHKIPYQSCLKTKALASLFLVALPTIVSSCYLWYQRHVASMGITTFIGVTTAALCIYIFFNPDDDIEDSFAQRWLLWFGLVYLLACANGILSPYFEHKAPMQWGLRISAVSVFVGSSIVLKLWLFNTSTLWLWAVFNVTVLVPLILIGLATQSSFLLVLTAGGILMDAFHVCYKVTEGMDETLAALVFFGVMGSTGILTALTGWFLSHRQDDLSRFFAAYLEPYAWPRRPAVEFEVLATHDLYLEAPPTTGEDGEGHPESPTRTGSYSLEVRDDLREVNDD